MSSEQAGGAAGSTPMSDRMRSLLSRAAEEQLHEQRQVSAVLTDLRTLVEDVDERLATGEQVDRVAEEVRALSARLDAVEARSAELAERITEATARVGGVTSTVEALVERSERRLATHVDDAVLALAEVVLRRRGPAVAASADVPDAERPLGARPAAAAPPDAPPTEPAAAPDRLVSAEGPPASAEPDAPAVDEPAVDEPPERRSVPDAPVAVDLVAAEDPGPGPAERCPGDGFVLVPADVADDDAEPALPVQQERRTTDRRTAERSDGSGRRRRSWWRRV